MNGFYEPQRHFSAEDMQRLTDMGGQHDAMMQLMNPVSSDSAGYMGATMDDILQQNDKDQQRRRPLHHSQSMDSQRTISATDPRRSSMLEFGSGSNAGLDEFQFNPGSLPSDADMQRPGNLAQRRLDSQRARRQMSHENLALNTNHTSMPSFHSMTSSSPYGQHISSADPMTGFDMSNDYMSNNMMFGMDFTTTPMETMSNRDATPRNTFMQSNLGSSMDNTSMFQNMSGSMSNKMHDPGGDESKRNIGSENLLDRNANMQMTDQSNIPQTQTPAIPMPNPNPGMPMNHEDMAMSTSGPHGMPTYIPATQAQAKAQLDVSSDSKGVPFQGQNNANQQIVPQYRNAYSSSGFDMLGVLMKVAQRPNPQITLGAVDMSCAFVVCDVTQHDVPIVYCSDVFERLTAYTRHEILGRNCRFLQSPDGKIQAGVKRKYVDDKSVLRIKNMITQRQEAQISVINYRKGGQPFMNLLTMIPIPWDDPNEIKYYVGFQVDLVEQPTSITNKNPGRISKSSDTY